MKREVFRRSNYYEYRAKNIHTKEITEWCSAKKLAVILETLEGNIQKNYRRGSMVRYAWRIERR